MGTVVWLRAKGQLTLPADVRESARLSEGDPLEVELTEEGTIVLRPQKVIDASQAWFWTEQWQAGERDASGQITAEDTVVYETADAFLAALDDPPSPRRAPRGRRRSR
ncbi:MAG TPA: AbrB/MazE/SpoVT family DNA-binding domain-containing protein [Actinomycetota bacterium]